MLLRSIANKVIEKSFNSLQGTGIGRIPFVFRLGCRLIHLTGGKIYTTVDGQKMSAIITPQGFLLYHWDGYEPNITKLFCSLIRDGMTVVDVGASIGYYTLLAAKRVGENGLVLAFEPDPYRFIALKENVEINGWKNTKIFRMALSDFEGESHFQILSIGGSFAIIGDKKRDEIITVMTTKLDSLLKSIGVYDVDLIKIDAEGAEVRIFRGMKELLSKGNVKVICDVYPDLIPKVGGSISELQSILKMHDYRIYIIESDSSLRYSDTLLSNSRKSYLFTREEI